MTHPFLEFHPEAFLEAEGAQSWYESRSQTAAEAFLDELDHAIAQITIAPERWARYLFGTRRYIMQRFPFLVVYREKSPSLIQIVAVAHGHRKPGYWRDRL